MRLFKIVPMTYDLFNGAAAAGTGGDGGAGEGAQAGGTQAGTQKPGSGRRARRSGGLDNVVYGKAPEAETQQQSGQEGSVAGSETKALTKEEKSRNFKSMIEGEYKDEYTAEFQRAFDRRFKDAKQNEEKLSQIQPLIETLSQKYKIEGGDLAKLVAAVQNDDSNFAAAAEEAGMDVPLYKNMLEMQKKAEAYDAMTRQNEARQKAEAQLRAWEEEGNALKEQYPEFDFAAEIQNKQFLSLLRSNVPVKTAYEAVHMEDIKTSLAQQTARQAEKRVTDGIRANGTRPAENGASSQSGIVYKSDPSKFTKADRAEIVRRSARGERIVL